MTLPTRSKVAKFTAPSDEVTRKTEEPEWVLPGLHVQYEAQQYRDTVTIELESATKARAQVEGAKEAASPKL